MLTCNYELRQNDLVKVQRMRKNGSALGRPYEYYVVDAINWQGKTQKAKVIRTDNPSSGAGFRKAVVLKAEGGLKNPELELELNVYKQPKNLGPDFRNWPFSVVFNYLAAEAKQRIDKQSTIRAVVTSSPERFEFVSNLNQKRKAYVDSLNLFGTAVFATSAKKKITRNTCETGDLTELFDKIFEARNSFYCGQQENVFKRLRHSSGGARRRLATHKKPNMRSALEMMFELPLRAKAAQQPVETSTVWEDILANID